MSDLFDDKIEWKILVVMVVLMVARMYQVGIDKKKEKTEEIRI